MLLRSRIRLVFFLLTGCVIGPSIIAARADATRASAKTQRQPVNAEKANQLRENLRAMIAQARDRVFPSLVNIRVITVRYWDGKEQKGQSVGSGTIISPQGHVLTNFHVVQKGRKFKCTLADKQEIAADLVGEDPLTDLAVLKLHLDELKDPTSALPVARFGDSDELEIGDSVMAMGSPWALSRSVTLGIVSNTERILAGGNGEMRFDRDQRTGIFNRWIQHDAAINPGNSGGPLINLKGEFIGVNARGSGGGGNMGFAIPANVASSVAAKLIEHGEVLRSWFGMSVKPIKKTGFKEGVLVNSVVEHSPAYRAGLRAGDVIVEIQGDPLTVWFPEEVPPLLKHLADRPIGSTVNLTYRRDDQTHETKVITEKLKKDRGDEAAFRSWGLVGLEITENMARERRLKSTEGVLVGSVRGGNPAQMAEPPLTYGDVIRSIDGQPIKDLTALIDRYEKIMEMEELPKYLLVEFDRRGRNNLTLLKPKPDKDEDPPRQVRKAWVGVAVQPVIKKLARQLGRPDDIGFRITRVYPRTLAADTDLQAGDIVLTLNGKRLKPRGMQDAGLFHRRIRRLDVGEQAMLTVLRDGRKREIAVKLERTKITRSEALRDRNRDFELAVREVTFFDRDENRWDETVSGVIIDQVESAGWAQLGGLWPGDLIQRIDHHEIHSLKDYRQAMEEVTKRQPERVVFVVLRGVRTNFQYVEPDWKPAVDNRSNPKKNQE